MIRLQRAPLDEPSTKPFRDRRHAGRRLAAALPPRPDQLVLALPRGGVPVGYEVARALGAPLDVFIVRKLGVPGREEFALGAIASGGVRIIDEALMGALGIGRPAVEIVAAREGEELKRRERAFRNQNEPLDPRGKEIIVVDDGLATGASMRAALLGLRARQPRSLTVAVPVAPASLRHALSEVADRVVCVLTLERFRAVGDFYDDFSQTSDAEVRELLERARTGRLDS